MIFNAKLSATETGVGVVVDISDWQDVGVTVDISGATTPSGNLQGSRGMGEITDIWEDLVAYSDSPTQIPNSIRRVRLNTAGIAAGEVVVEVCGN